MEPTHTYMTRSAKKKKQNQQKYDVLRNDESDLLSAPSEAICHDLTQVLDTPLDSAIEVKVNVQLFRLLSIDESTETVTLDLGITFIWNDPHLASMNSDVNFSTHPSISRGKTKCFDTIGHVEQWPEWYEPGIGAFDPAWKIADCSESQVVTSVTQVIDPAIGQVHSFTHLIAKIHRPLKLKDFPFDTQMFTFTIRSEHTVQVMRFHYFPETGPGARSPKIYDHDATEWKIEKGLKLTFALGDVSASDKSYCEMSFHINVKRKPEWYLNNVILVSYMIVSASFSVLLINEENMAERLGLIFTTWLLLISLKLVIADRIPKISYFTILDYYLLFSYLFMMVLVVHACAQKHINAFIYHTWESMPSHECNVLNIECLKGLTLSIMIWFEECPEFYFLIFFWFVWTFGHIVMGYQYCHDSPNFHRWSQCIDYFQILWQPLTSWRRYFEKKNAREKFADAALGVVEFVRDRKRNV